MSTVERAKTAMYRTRMSRPVSQALLDGLVGEGRSLFDYGCGRGGDVQRLVGRGIEASGWDPVHRPDTERRSADVVNLGYVINVIEARHERDDVLRRAWALTRGVLIVSGRLINEAIGLDGTTYGDGLVTRTRTFQRFYTQDELRTYVEQTLGLAAVAAAPGIFYVFRQISERENFLLTRIKRTISRPLVSLQLLERHRGTLDELVAFLHERGRLPRPQEWRMPEEAREALGTTRQAFQVLKRTTGSEAWDRVRMARSDDLLVFLALGRLSGRPRVSELPDAIQWDIRDFFGNYKAACDQADRLLFAAGEEERLLDAARAAAVGKRTPMALYVHVEALDELAPVLRIREGCARAIVGAVEEATIVKLHLDKPKVSYLSYPDFERHPHPALDSGYIVSLDGLRADYRNYSGHRNPPILHRKELLVSAEHPTRPKFTRLTRQEERAGLFASTQRIGTRAGWADALRRAGVELRGHRLVRSSSHPPSERTPSERPRTDVA